MSFLCLSVYLVTLLTLKHLYGKKSYCVNLFSNTIRYNSTWFGTTMGWVVCSFLFYSIEQFYVEGTRHFCVFKLILTHNYYGNWLKKMRTDVKKKRDTKNDITFECVFTANQFKDYYTKRFMSNENYISIWWALKYFKKRM